MGDERIASGDCRRVLMTADTVGGVWTYALELIRALDAHGIRVGLAAMGAPLNADQRESAGRIPNLELFESSFKLEWMEDPWDDVAEAGRWLLELESRFRPGIVHLNGYSHAALPFTRPKLVVAHSCVLSWWEAVHREAAPARWNRYRAEVGRGIAAADLVVAPSRAMLEAVERHYGPLARSVVVPNGRDAACFPPALKGNFLLSAGRFWDKAKNVAALECIAAQLNWPVCLAGEEKNPQGSAIQFDSIRYLGRLKQKELATWYGRASIYVLPARYEPFGLSILEAALAGCALVIGDIPSLRELWSDAAVLVPPDNTRMLKSVLEDLITDTARRERLARLARARALEFTPQRMASGYLKAYTGLLASTARSRTAICAL